MDLNFRPSLLDALQGYRRSDFSADLGAGVTVACVAMPLAMASGIASGARPEQGSSGRWGRIEALLDPAEPLPDITVLEMHRVINMDTTGLDALRGLHRHPARRNGRLMLAELNDQPMSLLKRSGFLDEIGRRNVFDASRPSTPRSGHRPKALPESSSPRCG